MTNETNETLSITEPICFKNNVFNQNVCQSNNVSNAIFKVRIFHVLRRETYLLMLFFKVLNLLCRDLQTFAFYTEVINQRAQRV